MPAFRLQRAGRRAAPIQRAPSLKLTPCDKVREPCKPMLVFVASDEAKKAGLSAGAYLRYCGRTKEKPADSTYVRVNSPADAAKKNRRVCECVGGRRGRIKECARERRASRKRRRA